MPDDDFAKAYRFIHRHCDHQRGRCDVKDYDDDYE